MNQQFLQKLPLPLMAIDGALRILAYSQRVLGIFGIRSRSRSDETSRDLLGAAIAADTDLSDQLALATAQLAVPGDEEIFEWRHGEHIYEIRAYAVEEEEGVFLVAFEDETEHIQTEEILSKIRQYNENVLKNIPLGVIVLNSELRGNFITPQEIQLLGQLGIALTLFDSVGSTLTELLPPEPGTEWQRMCESVLQSGKLLDAGKQAYPTDEGDLFLATTVIPLPESMGLTGGVMLVSEDVTEKKRLEEELVRVGKLATVGQMVITVNHEINNPLSIISSSAQALRLLNPNLDEKIVGKLLVIEEQVKRISAVTERLRSMEQVDTNEYISSGPQMIDVWKKSGRK